MKGQRRLRHILKWLILLPLSLRLNITLPLCAQEQTISQMIRTSWTARDGAPQNINNLAQTGDGTLWLGTRDGLYSFDGIKFSVFQPLSGVLPRKNVQHLFVANDDSLWIFGDPSTPPIRIRDGVATVFNRVDQGTFGFFDKLQQSTDGTLWGILDARELLRLGGDGIWHVFAGPKLHPGLMASFFIDSSDTQWLVIDDMLYRRPRDEEEFTSTGIPVYGGRRFAEGRDHSIWIVSTGPLKPVAPARQPPVAGFMHVDRVGNRLPNPVARGNDISNIAIAGDGSIWVSHTQSGLQRLQPWEIKGKALKGDEDPSDLFDVTDGLTTTGYRQLLRDRDENIWVGGGRGLDYFQRAIMVPVVKKAISGWWSVCASQDGEVWLAVLDGFLAEVKGHRLARLKDHFGITSIFCSEDGRVRWLDDSGIAEVHRQGIERLPLLPEHGPYRENYEFTSVAALPDHRLIASTLGFSRNPLWILDNGTWEPFLSSAGITDIRAMMLGRNNRLYLGSQDGRITVLKVTGFDVQSSAPSGIGAVEGFSETSYGTFAFGENGIALEQKGSFRMLSFSNPELATSVTGLVEDRDRNIWINGSFAIARIASAEITIAVSEPSHNIAAREFREGDFKGSDIFRYSRNSAQIDTQGGLWFPTANGVIYIDPQHIDRPSHPPTLSIRSITADGRDLPANRNFPPSIETLNVSYFGLNLSNPTGVVYRYKLEGSDTSWQEVGTRSEAVYTHLRPGEYVFQVEASNGNGIWTAPLNTAPFRILPAFYQTWWFLGLCVVSGVLLLWLGLMVRVRIVTAGIRQRAEERADERVRIARELHDTLLQGVQGLLLSFHVAAEKVPADHVSKKSLEKALTTADRIIVEGRNRVSRLRSENLNDAELKSLIEGIGASFNTAAIDFGVERNGGSDHLQNHVVDEVFCIAREAVTNAFRYSAASRIAVELNYQKREFRMSCHDNGRGFDPVALSANATNGHWGLRGMAERAERIGAEFACSSSPNQGTEIHLRVPARLAYARSGMLERIFKRRRAA